MDQRELLKNFYLFTDVTSNDLQALEAIVERRFYMAGDLIVKKARLPMRVPRRDGTVDIVPKEKERVSPRSERARIRRAWLFRTGTRPASVSAREPLISCRSL